VENDGPIALLAENRRSNLSASVTINATRIYEKIALGVLRQAVGDLSHANSMLRRARRIPSGAQARQNGEIAPPEGARRS
jgi:hypothetical protein